MIPRPTIVKNDVRARGAPAAKYEAEGKEENSGQQSKKIGPQPMCISFRAVVEAQILRVARSLTPSA